MAKKMSCIVIVLVSAFFLCQVNASTTKDMALIESMCKKTHDYKLCISILKSNPRSFNTDVKGLARIMMDVIQGKIDGILGVNHQMGKKASDPHIRQCLNNVCYPEYDTTEATIQYAIEYLESNSLREALTYVYYARENDETCENCFVEPITNIYIESYCISAVHTQMAKKVSSIVLVLVSAFFLYHVNASSTKDIALTESVCKEMHDYKLCFSILKSNPHSFNTDVKGLACITMDVIKGKIDGVLAVIRQTEKNASDPGILECLKNVCYIEYDGATPYIQYAIEYLESGSLREALTYVHYVLDDEESCENCFVEPPIERKSSITPINSYFAAICKITEDIIVILLK